MSLAEETEAGIAGGRLLELIGERSPPDVRQRVRAFAQAYLRRLSRRRVRGHLAPRRCSPRSSARSSSRPRAATSRSPCARSTRRSRSTATSRSARCSRRTRTTCRSWSTRCPARSSRTRARDRAAAAPDRSASSATATAGSPRRPRPRRARTASRSCTSTSTAGWTTSELEELEDARPRRAGRRPRVVADFPAMTERVGDMVKLARAGAARYPHDEVDEVADFLDWLLHGNFILLGAREYDIAERGHLRRRRLRARDPARRGGVRASRASVPLRRAAARHAASAHRAATCCWSPRPTPLAGAPARADGLHRRAPRRRAPARSSASRGCSACSPRRRTPSGRRRRRCCTASCARCSRPRT